MRIEANGGCGCLLIILIFLGVESLIARLMGFTIISLPILILYIILILIILKLVRCLLK